MRLEDGSVASLHVNQLADFADTCAALMKANVFEVGQHIDNALVIGEATGKSQSKQISLKPLLCKAVMQSQQESAEDCGAFPSSIAGCSPGQMVVGYVHKVETYGVLVRFGNRLTALVPRAQLADCFVSTAVGWFTVGDSVRCVIQRVDLSTNRIMLTSKPSLVASSTTLKNIDDYATARLKEDYMTHASPPQVSSLVSNGTASDIAASDMDECVPNWQKYPIGTRTSAVLTSVKDYGWVFLADDQTSIILVPKSNVEGANKELTKAKKGDVCTVFILHVDFEKKVLEGSCKQKLTTIQSATPKKSKKEKKSLVSAAVVEGQLSTVVIEMIKNTFVVVSHGTEVGVLMVQDYHCPYKTTKDAGFEVHQEVEVVVTKVGAGGLCPHDAVFTCTLASASKKRDVKDAVEDLTRTRSSSISSTASTADEHIAKFRDSLRLGGVLKWAVVKIDLSAGELHLLPANHAADIATELTVKGVVHVTAAINSCHACDDMEKILTQAAGLSRQQRLVSNGVHAMHPFGSATTAVGSIVSCHVLQVRHTKGSGGKEEITVYLGLETPHIASTTITKSTTESNYQNTTQMSATPTSSSHQSGASAYRRMIQWKGKDSVRVNHLYAVVVTKLEATGVWVSISPYVSARLSYADVSTSITVCQSFQRSCFVGQRLVVVVTKLSDTTTSGSQRMLIEVSRSRVEDVVSGAMEFDLSQGKSIDLPDEQDVTDKHYKTGSMVFGVVDRSNKRVANQPAVAIQLAHHMLARCCVSELADKAQWKDLTSFFSPVKETDNFPLSGKGASHLVHGAIVPCRILTLGNGQRKVLEVTLRPSRLVSTCYVFLYTFSYVLICA